MSTLFARQLKKVSSLVAVCAIFTSLLPLSTHAALGGNFIATQTQSAIVRGLDNTQSISHATTQENKTETAAGVLMDSILVTSDILGTTGNSLAIDVFGTENMPPARQEPGVKGEIVIQKSGNRISVEIRNSSDVTITQAELSEALNMSASGTIRGGFVIVTLQSNVSGDITASGGNTNAVSNMSVSLSGGSPAQNQIDTITLGGTIEIGDIFTVNLSQGPVSLTAASTDMTLVANALNTAIQSVLAYNLQNYTTSVSGNVITVTAKTAGNGLTVGAPTATNAPGRSQIITFTPGNPEVGETFRATIDGNNYDELVSTGDTVQNIVENIQLMTSLLSGVTCTEDDTKIICETTAGRSVTYSASVIPASSIPADTTAPVLTQVTPIASGTDTTPDYVLSTTEAGTIMYTGSCTSTQTAVTAGTNTITLDVLAVGTYSDCSLNVTDAAGNTSNTLTIPAFTISAVSSGSGGGGGGGGSGGGSSRSSSRSSSTTTTKTTTVDDELICKGPAENGNWYEKCSNTTTETFRDFADKMACEGFITAKTTDEEYEMTKTAPRKEVVAVAVSMLKENGKPVEMTPRNEYKNHFTDIGVDGQATWIQGVVETALAHGIISNSRTTFQPENPVTRAEAYAMIMGAVCLKPVATEATWQENIFATAQAQGLTARTWATFESESAIMRQDLFVVASRAADWAEKTGGCNPKPAECIAE